MPPLYVPPSVSVRVAVMPEMVGLKVAFEKVSEPVPLLRMLPAPVLPAVAFPTRTCLFVEEGLDPVNSKMPLLPA